jgi:hypothetical protein
MSAKIIRKQIFNPQLMDIPELLVILISQSVKIR